MYKLISVGKTLGKVILGPQRTSGNTKGDDPSGNRVRRERKFIWEKIKGFGGMALDLCGAGVGALHVMFGVQHT